MNFDQIDLKVEKKALCDQVADRIEQMILTDKSQAQQKLPSEQALSAGFGVSRPVIREALTILKARGLVAPRQGGGSYITVPSSTQLMDTVNRLTLMRDISKEDVCAVRIQLEAMAARLAAEHATAEELDELEALNRKMEEHRTDSELRADLDLQFHQCIAKLSGNHLLKCFVQSMNGLLRPMLVLLLCLPMANEDGIAYHDRIIQALRSGDGEKSERLIRDHLMLFIRNYELVKEQRKEDEA